MCVCVSLFSVLKTDRTTKSVEFNVFGYYNPVGYRNRENEFRMWIANVVRSTGQYCALSILTVSTLSIASFYVQSFPRVFTAYTTVFLRVGIEFVIFTGPSAETPKLDARKTTNENRT